SGRSTYLLDVRSPAEFRERHIAGSRSAPGGQLVQATDEYIAARAARVILVDPEQVRAVMTASWLEQMGLPEVCGLLPEGEDGFAGWATAEGEAGAPGAREAPSWREIEPGALAGRLADPGIAVLDLASSLRHRARHVAGAWWGVRSRLGEARDAIAASPVLRELVLTADDPRLARFAAPE